MGPKHPPDMVRKRFIETSRGTPPAWFGLPSSLSIPADEGRPTRRRFGRGGCRANVRRRELTAQGKRDLGGFAGSPRYYDRPFRDTAIGPEGSLSILPICMPVLPLKTSTRV